MRLLAKTSAKEFASEQKGADHHGEKIEYA